MGDIADWINERCDDHDFDEDREQRCRYCGERGLYFEERGWKRWILVDEDGDAHMPHCKGRMAKPSEFPEIPDEA